MVGMEGSGLAGMGSVLASLMFLYAILRQFCPSLLDDHLSRYVHRLLSLVSPHVHIRFPEYSPDGARLLRSEAYAAIDAYLASACSATARRLRADPLEGSSALTLSMDDHEEVADSFRGARLWWSSLSIPVKTPSIALHAGASFDERRFYQLTFHRRHRELVNLHYLPHVMREGRAAAAHRRQRKLYTNNPSPSPYSPPWSHVPFEHPATFDTVAMDPVRKRELLADLEAFRRAAAFYARVGRAWKRGYLLHGPPGTGKSSLVAAIANFLEYDVYDVELTAVASNTALRRLLIETSSKSVVVIEDIDCSLDLTGRRQKRKETPPVAAEEEAEGKVTLSGLLNFIDGLWSACGGERVIVFTTNHVARLDPALIRRGRMDVHVELSYCGFEAFRVLARNYLGLEGEHAMYSRVKELMEEVRITPADVAECLMHGAMTSGGKEEEEDGRMACLEHLVRVMEEMRGKKEKEEEGEEEDDGKVVDHREEGGVDPS